MAAKLGRLAVNNTAFLLCDIQEKFRPSIRYFPEIIKVAQRMVSPVFSDGGEVIKLKFHNNFTSAYKYTLRRT